MKKILLSAIVLGSLVTAFGLTTSVKAQTVTPTVTPTTTTTMTPTVSPTTTVTVPSGAPATGHAGK